MAAFIHLSSLNYDQKVSERKVDDMFVKTAILDMYHEGKMYMKSKENR